MKLFLSICFLFLFTTNSSSQMIEKVGRTIYAYDGKVYKKQDLGFVYGVDTESNKLFLRAKSNKKVSRNLLYVGLGSFVAGNLLILSALNNDYYDNVGRLVYGALLGYMLAPTLALIAIPFGLSASHKFKKAINMHNFDFIEINGFEKDQSFLNLEITNNGLGLVYRF